MAVTRVAPQTAPAPAAGDGSPEPGQGFGPRYHIIRLLGMGGMGAVYQAWDAELGVAVALKIIRTGGRGSTASPELEKRFKNELLLARQVTHKNVVRIHDLGTINGVKYISMPYIQGDDLAAILRRDGKMPIERALKVARQIAMGLAAAHEAGVVHRDLKPHNVMIAAEDQVQIMDFGISRPAGDATAGEIVGTPEYMAPEQVEGQVVDARADIYAFGLILYELLMGPRPRAETGTDRVAAMRQRIADGFPRLRSVDAAIPEPVDEIVARCLDGDPQARYKNGAELQAALDRLDADGSLLPIPRRLSRWQMAAASLALVAAVGGTWWLAQPVPQIQREPVPILVADFENRSGDPAFEGSIEQTLTLAMETAPYISVFRTRDARAIAAELSPDKSDRITEQAGQLVARREGLKVVLAGSIDGGEGAYRVEMRATDPATGQPITSVSQTVRDKTQVLAAVASMATSVREALGESESEIGTLAAAETMTAGSLEAMRAYARAQELTLGNKIQEALQEYERAVQFDPRFGRAYAGMANIHANYFKDPNKAEGYYQTALQHLDRMTDREKYRTLGTYYLNVARNHEKAIENYEALVKLFPADDGGHGNLALAYLQTGNLPRAVEEVRKTLEIYPRNFLQRYNYAMYAMYAGDFATAISEATRVRQESPGFEYSLLPIALSQLAQGDAAAAKETYAQLSTLSPIGASFAQLGEADMNIHFGQYRAAIRILHEGIAADAKRKSSSDVAQKYVALAEAHLALGELDRAAAAAMEATKLNRLESTLFPAARVLLQAGHEGRALEIAAELEKMLQRQTTAYARLITGEVALRGGRLLEGIEALRDAQKRHDSWFSRFLLGRTYVEAGHFAEGVAELELAVTRRGETTDVFIYDMPTLRYLPPAYYWLARAHEGIAAKIPARENYSLFLKFRAGADPADSLAADAARRLRSVS